jgi:hypothetical protein
MSWYSCRLTLESARLMRAVRAEVCLFEADAGQDAGRDSVNVRFDTVIAPWNDPYTPSLRRRICRYQATSKAARGEPSPWGATAC